MTELHSHILPGIDDGANTISDSLEILNLELADGVSQIALTSHFYPQQDKFDDFISRRERAYAEFTDGVSEAGLQLSFKLGSEVHYSPALIDYNLNKLSIGDTGYILIELPYIQRPTFFDRVIREICEMGLVPIIAHVDRYDYAMEDIRLLYDWIQLGCVLQVNAESIIDTESNPKLLYKLIKWGLVHVIASDTHSVISRPPMLAKAYERIEKEMGPQYADLLRVNADKVFAGEKIEVNPHEPKKTLLGWK